MHRDGYLVSVHREIQVSEPRERPVKMIGASVAYASTEQLIKRIGVLTTAYALRLAPLCRAPWQREGESGRKKSLNLIFFSSFQVLAEKI